MSNKVRTRKNSTEPEGDWIAMCIQTQRGLEFHCKRHDGHDAPDYGYVLAGIAESMADTLGVDVDTIWTFALSRRKEIARNMIRFSKDEKLNPSLN